MRHPIAQQLKVVGRGCHGKLLGGTGEASKLGKSELQVAFEVPKYALDTFSSLSCTGICFGSGKCADVVARVLVDQPGNGALSGRGTLLLERAPSAIGCAVAVSANLIGGYRTTVGEKFVSPAAVSVGVRVVSERVAGEEAVPLTGAIDHRDVRSDALLHQPTEQWTAAICFVRSEA